MRFFVLGVCGFPPADFSFSFSVCARRCFFRMWGVACARVYWVHGRVSAAGTRVSGVDFPGACMLGLALSPLFSVLSSFLHFGQSSRFSSSLFSVFPLSILSRMLSGLTCWSGLVVFFLSGIADLGLFRWFVRVLLSRSSLVSVFLRRHPLSSCYLVDAEVPVSAGLLFFRSSPF